MILNIFAVPQRLYTGTITDKQLCFKQTKTNCGELNNSFQTPNLNSTGNQLPKWFTVTFY